MLKTLFGIADKVPLEEFCNVVNGFPALQFSVYMCLLRPFRAFFTFLFCALT